MNSRTGSAKPDLPRVDPEEGAGLQVPRAPAAPDESESGWRDRVAGYADQVQAFTPSVFRADDEGDGSDDAALVAGALILASTMLIDELFEDITALAPHSRADGAGLDGLLALGELPPQFAHRYDGRFARKFLVASVMIIGRFSTPHWDPPANVAEALALHLVVQRAQALLVDHGCCDEEQARDLYAGFEEAAFEDADHEWLYQATRTSSREDGGVADSPDAAVLSWFEPFPEMRAHPFVTESETN